MTRSRSPSVKPLRPLAEKTLAGRPRSSFIIGLAVASAFLILLILALLLLYRSAVRPPDVAETLREVVPELDREALQRAVERARRAPAPPPPGSPAPSPLPPAPQPPAERPLQSL